MTQPPLTPVSRRRHVDKLASRRAVGGAVGWCPRLPPYSGDAVRQGGWGRARVWRGGAAQVDLAAPCNPLAAGRRHGRRQAGWGRLGSTKCVSGSAVGWRQHCGPGKGVAVRAVPPFVGSSNTAHRQSTLRSVLEHAGGAPAPAATQRHTGRAAYPPSMVHSCHANAAPSCAGALQHAHTRNPTDASPFEAASTWARQAPPRAWIPMQQGVPGATLFTSQLLSADWKACVGSPWQPPPASEGDGGARPGVGGPLPGTTPHCVNSVELHGRVNSAARRGGGGGFIAEGSQAAAGQADGCQGCEAGRAVCTSCACWGHARYELGTLPGDPQRRGRCAVAVRGLQVFSLTLPAG